MGSLVHFWTFFSDLEEGNRERVMWDLKKFEHLLLVTSFCTCGQYNLAVTCSRQNSASDESKVILTVENRNKKKANLKEKKRKGEEECADAFKCLCAKPQALLWLWEANVKPITYFSNACAIRHIKTLGGLTECVWREEDLRGWRVEDGVGGGGGGLSKKKVRVALKWPQIRPVLHLGFNPVLVEAAVPQHES